mmetsp:Transcript_4486/g.12223  ORF Transcript_4486/g.12223 Transcript_4486/m.12223 type:complete len:210 (-) Transcript_4486:140-769(-)
MPRSTRCMLASCAAHPPSLQPPPSIPAESNAEAVAPKLLSAQPTPVPAPAAPWPSSRRLGGCSAKRSRPGTSRPQLLTTAQFASTGSSQTPAIRASNARVTAWTPLIGPLRHTTCSHSSMGAPCGMAVGTTTILKPVDWPNCCDIPAASACAALAGTATFVTASSASTPASPPETTPCTQAICCNTSETPFSKASSPPWTLSSRRRVPG